MTAPMTMRDALLGRISDAMREHEDIFFLSADFGAPILDDIRKDFPDRFINVGVAEQNLINVAAGLSLEGYRVFAYAIAPFITMRCYEQTRVNLALLSEVRELNVTLIGVGAGYSYVVSGPTHQCYEDLTLMRALPNMQVFSPSDHRIAAACMEPCLQEAGPKYMRLDAQVLPCITDDEADVDMDLGFRIVHEGDDGCIVATGYMVHTALEAAENLRKEGFSITVVDMFDLGRFSQPQLLDILAKHDHILTLEEGFVGAGGLDALVRSLCTEAGIGRMVHGMGVPRKYMFELGSRAELHGKIGLDPGSVARNFQEIMRGA